MDRPYRPRGRREYSVGIICALPLEKAAVVAAFDAAYERPIDLPLDDPTPYDFGLIGAHNVVVACLPDGRVGKSSAAIAATNMSRSFSILVGLMVGIGGGVWSATNNMRLGDIIVSRPSGQHGGLVEWDFGKEHPQGFQRTGSLPGPPTTLLNALTQVKTKHMFPEQSGVKAHLASIVSKLGPAYAFQNADDSLFRPEYEHQGGDTCTNCRADQKILRPPRSTDPVVFYGNIASGDKVIKEGRQRDTLARSLDVICFEMEAAGIRDTFPCMVIRGVSDYADSHKNDRWQPYAAAAAAAYAKELLSFVRLPQPELQLPPDSTLNPRKRAFASDDESQGGISPFSVSPLSRTNMNENDRTLSAYGNNMESTAHAQEDGSSFFESLKFDTMTSRFDTIATAETGTCKWLFETSQYKNWRDESKLSEHHGFLWIKGKPGSGKSTVLKFAFNNARQNLEGKVLISFFFNARGEILERTVEGMYRSLLYQILEKLPFLQNNFRSRTFAGSGASVEALQEYLREAVDGLKEEWLVCYVDALDECPEEEVRNMVSFFEDLGESAYENGRRFYVLLSSRYYPHIDLAKYEEIRLDEQDGHKQDIQHYIKKKLRVRASQAANKLKSEIEQRASGVFLWVVLVVGILRKDHDQGNIHDMQKRLREIPDKLGDLFNDIINRDLRNKEQLILTLQWILFAKRPLTCAELYQALRSADTHSDSRDLAIVEIDFDDMKKFILDRSKGLAEMTKGKTARVQFIHESVREYLMGPDGLSSYEPRLRLNLAGLSHETFRECIILFLERMDISTDPWNLSSIIKFPFLGYALEALICHAEHAQQNGIPQKEFVQSRPGDHWAWLSTCMVSKSALISPRRHPVSRHYLLAAESASGLLQILFEEDDIIPKEDPQSLRDRDPRNAFEMAISLGDIPCVKLFLEHNLDAICTQPKDALKYFEKRIAPKNNQTQTDELLLSLYQRLSPTVQDWYDLWKMIIARGPRQRFERLCEAHLAESEEIHQEALAHARKHNLLHCADLILREIIKHDFRTVQWSRVFDILSGFADKDFSDRLLNRILTIGSSTNELSLALRAMAQRGDLKQAQLLLKHGAFVNMIPGSSNVPALTDAARGGHQDMVHLLLDCGANVNGYSPWAEPALVAAVRSGSRETVRLLLDRGADVNMHDGFFETALVAAARIGSQETVCLLLDRGADIDFNHERYGTALVAAARAGHQEIVEELLGRHADIHQQTEQYGPALHAAIANGRQRIACLLLVHGADIDAQSKKHGSALEVAIRNAYPTIVELLLSCGANVNLHSVKHGSALRVAVGEGNYEIARLLLEGGANANPLSEEMPLLHAAVDKPQRYKMVELLLKHGANVNLRHEKFGSVLQKVQYYYPMGTDAKNDMIELLKAHGAIDDPQ